MTEMHSHGKVLLVEDEPLIGSLVAEALVDGGFDVHSVANAEEALAALENGLKVDLLFTDINLPGMDGRTLAESARRMNPDLPVIYASGRWTLLDALRSVPRSAVLPKPYSLTRACLAVEDLLGVRPQAVAAAAH
jgi:CheY-like chemotaxis protein